MLAGLQARGLLVSSHDRVSKAGPPRATLSAVEQKLADQLAAWKLEPQRPKDMPTALGLAEPQVKAALERLTAAKVIVKVKADLYVHAQVLDELRAKLVAFLEANKTIDAQQWKELAGVSRKFSIPFAEHFDAEKLTLRVGDLRRKR